MEKTAGSWEIYIYKKKQGAGEGETWKRGWWMDGHKDEEGGVGREKGEVPQNCLSVEVRARPLMGDSIEQNMYWRQRLCLLPVPFQ